MRLEFQGRGRNGASGRGEMTLFITLPATSTRSGASSQQAARHRWLRVSTALQAQRGHGGRGTADFTRQVYHPSAGISQV